MLRFVYRHLAAHPIRSLLTALSVAVAVCLLCVLRAGLVGLESAVTAASVNRLWVQSAVSLYVDLPLSYEQKIASVAGVENSCKFQWFGGIYQDPKNFFAQFGVDADEFDLCYPELEIIEGEYEAFERNRAGCVVGQGLIEEHGWKIGDTVPIQGTIFPRADGSAWEFQIEAIYRAKTTALDQRTMYFQFDYLEQAIEAGDAIADEVSCGVYLAKLSDDANPTEVMAAIDGMFENGPQRVQTTTEAEFGRQFISMLGNVPLLLSAIGGAVLFAIFFAVLNTMLAAARERTRTIGIIKALGFSNRFVATTMLAESVFVCLIGGVVGLGLAFSFEGPLSSVFAGMIQSFAIDDSVAVLGFGIALTIGVVAGIAPAIGATRLTPIQALREN